MRLNPFSRGPKDARDAPEDDSSAEEDIAIARLKSRHSSGASGRPRRDSKRFDPAPESLASSARGRAASRSRGRSPSPSLRKLPPGARAVVRGRSTGRSVKSERDASSSPESAPPRGRNRDSARGKRRSIARGRGGSSSPEPEMEHLSARGGGSRRGGGPSVSSVSRRSRSTRRSLPPASPSSESDDSGPERMSSSRGQLKRSSSRASRRSSNRRREVPMRRPSSRRLVVDDDDDDDDDEDYDHPRRGRVALSRSRSYNSRRAASLAPPPPSRNRRASYGAPERRRSSSRAPYQSRSLSQAPIRRNFRGEEPAPEKPKKRGFKALFGLKKFKKQDARDDDDDSSSLESFDPASDQRAPPPPTTSERKAPPEVENAVVENYTVPKRETFANLYEYDNFPAIDRVPTAIGYQSDDSKDEVYIGGAPVPVADDTSVTSRYSVDVRSVRSSKLKRYAGDPDSDNDNDDKYSQYLSGNNTDAIHSDDSDSCRPQWHYTLDLDDSDWYDDEDEDDDAMNKMSKQRGNKKYQVSGNKKKKKTTQEKGEPSSQAKGSDEVPEEDPGDAIVANRSDEKEGNRVPRQKELEDEQGLDEDNENGLHNRRRQRRGGKGGRRNRFDDETMDDDDDDSLSDSDDDLGKSRKAKGRKKQHVLKEKGIIMNNHGKQNPKTSKKGKMRGFANRFRAFGKRNAGYTSDAEESEPENIGLTPNQSMFSEDPSSWRADPTLTKLEEDERRVSTATHNMLRASRKEISELDEMDEMSLGSNANQASCFPFSLAAFNSGGGTSLAPQQGTSSFCFYPSTGHGDNLNDFPLDDVQIQRLKDAKYDLENKPKVEVILQDLQDPLAEKYDQLEKAQRKKKSETQKQREIQEQNAQREREELLRRKREMREMEQKKLQMLQHKDALALQEAPDLRRGKSQSFVMDISDWVLNLDNDTPRKSPAAKDKDTPRTNGRDGSTDPVDKLPFSTIEVPTTTTIDTGDFTESAAGSSWGGRRKKRHEDDYSQQYSQRRPKSSSKPKATKKKKGWFRRG